MMNSLSARLRAALEWARARLIDDARYWWRMWSLRLAAIGSIIISYVLASPDILLRTMNDLPPDLRGYFPPVAGFMLFGLVTTVRLYKQGIKDGR